MHDSTAGIRRDMIATGQPHADLTDVQEHGEQTWDTQELQCDFEVLGFAAPFVVVRRRSDGVAGSLEFTHHPRVYFGWRQDDPDDPGLHTRVRPGLIPIDGGSRRRQP